MWVPSHVLPFLTSIYSWQKHTRMWTVNFSVWQNDKSQRCSFFIVQAVDVSKNDKGALQMFEVLRGEWILDYPGGPNLITQVLKNQSLSLLHSEGQMPGACLVLTDFGRGGRAYGQKCSWPLETSRDNDWRIQKDILYRYLDFYLSSGDGTQVFTHARQVLRHWTISDFIQQYILGFWYPGL